MFQGNINLIKRINMNGTPGRTHVGVLTNGYMVSICNLEWRIDDKVSIAPTTEVTCKRCKKIIELADENGNYRIRGKK